MRKVIFTLCLLASVIVASAQVLSAPILTTNNYCPGSSVSLNVKSTGGAFPSNVYFGAQLSNSSGSFASGTTILGYDPVADTKAQGGGKTFTAAFPSALGTTYRIRAVTLNTTTLAVVNTGADNGADVTIGTPTVTNPGTKTFCAGTATLAFTGTAVTSYTWTNSNTSTGLAASGSGNLSFTATNATTAAINGNVTVTPWSGPTGTGCSGSAQSFSLVVNPTPTVNTVGSQTLCSGSSTTAVSFTGSVSGTSYGWTNTATSIGLAASGTGNIASFTSANATTAAVTATITVVPSYTNNSITCTGTSGSFTIAVNPRAWTGTTSADWNTSGNWSCGIPTSSDDIIIPTGTTFAPSIISSTSGSVRNLTINSGVTLTLDGTMNVAGTLSNSGTITYGGSSAINAPSASFTFSTVRQLPAIIAQSVTLSGAGNYTTGGDITATSLDLSNTASVTLGSSNLTFGSISNASSSAYIIAAGSGMLKHAGSATFPVGTSSSYYPVSVSNGTTYTWGVNMQSTSAHPYSYTGSQPVATTWHITPYTGATPQTSAAGTTLSFQFPSSDTTGTSMNLTNGGSAKVYHFATTPTTGPLAGWQFVGNGGVIVAGSTITVSGVSASEFSPFAITGPSSILPVRLIAFSGKRTGSRNTLSWITTAEEHNRGFEILRSNDGVNYTAIGFVKSLSENGSSNSDISYSFDDNAASDNAYYRLNQLDIDNHATLSKVVKLSATSGKADQISGLYPNPATSQISAQVEATRKGSVIITVLDGLGRPVMTRRATVVDGVNSISVAVANLARGRYLLQVIYEDQSTSSVPFVKQ
jgi:hypothetical protein